MYRKSLYVIILLLIANLSLSDEVIVKININDINKLPPSIIDNSTIRFQGQSFILAQGDEKLFTESYLYTILDKIKPNFAYYIIRIGKNHEDLDIPGSILLRFNDSALVRINQTDELKLISLGLPLVSLPEGISYKPKFQLSPQLNLKPYISESVIIKDIINSVSPDNLRNLVLQLQENKDLNPPHNPYRSRYCLRVKETDDPSDSAADNAAEYIYNKFKDYGLDVEYDIFSHEVLTQGHYEMRNVIGTLKGKGPNSNRIFIISSHYDSVASKTNNWLLDWKRLPAPGANDNASGTSAVIEAARILSQYEFDSTIKFVVFSGEELGLHGSKHFAKLALQNNYEIAGVFNLDMIAYDPNVIDIDIITNQDSNWLAEIMLSIQKKYNLYPLILNKIVNADMVYSDHSPFWHNGYNAILCIENSNFESPEFYPFMHTADDTIDKLNFDMASRMAQIVIGTVSALANPVEETPYPDLAVYDKEIIISKENPTLGETINISAKVHNIGKVDAKNAIVQVWIEENNFSDPFMIAEKAVDIIANGYIEITASTSLTDWGNHKIIIKVNPDFSIFETDGRNNTASKTIQIGSATLSLGKLLIYPNPINTNINDKLNIAYSLSHDASVRLDIYNILGEIIYRQYFMSGEVGGKFGYNKGITWDTKNMSGEKVASGMYFFRIEASDNNGGTETSLKKVFIIR
ncbi:MAG: M20/M25/M40 family metallo-hydrolase [bacterium]